MTTYALVGASEFNSEQFSARNGAGAFDAVIAVDGGFTSLADVGCAPDLAIGDFDSLGYVPEGVEVLVFPPEKDASDMELALGEAVARRRRCRGGLRGARRPARSYIGEFTASRLFRRAWPDSDGGGGA